MWVCIFWQNVVSLTSSLWNFKKSWDELKQQLNEVCTKPNLYSCERKMIKLVYTSLRTLATNFSFSQNIFTSVKESDLFISVSVKNFMFLGFLFIYWRKNWICSDLLNNNKNIMHLSFLIHRFEIFLKHYDQVWYINFRAEAAHPPRLVKPIDISK